MRFFGTTVVILLVLIVEDVISHCPESGCECGKFCVDSNKRWCNSNNDRECSCVKGCLAFDRLMKVETTQTIYCSDCACATFFKDGLAVCIGENKCVPGNLTVHVDYPASGNESPNCKTSDENGGDDDNDNDNLIPTDYEEDR